MSVGVDVGDEVDFRCVHCASLHAGRMGSENGNGCGKA